MKALFSSCRTPRSFVRTDLVTTISRERLRHVSAFIKRIMLLLLLLLLLLAPSDYINILKVKSIDREFVTSVKKIRAKIR